MDETNVETSEEEAKFTIRPEYVMLALCLIIVYGVIFALQAT